MYAYPERLKKLGLPTLEYRRQKHADVLQVFKILQGIDNVELTVINFSHYHHIRQLEAILTSYISLEQDSMCDQTVFQILLFTFGMHCHSVVLAPSVNGFKNRLDIHWHNHPFKFNPACYMTSQQASQDRYSNAPIEAEST